MVEQTNDPAELQAIIDELLQLDPQNPCIVAAAAKQAELTQTAAPPGPVALN